MGACAHSDPNVDPPLPRDGENDADAETIVMTAFKKGKITPPSKVVICENSKETLIVTRLQDKLRSIFE
jgi:hypothetical protein